MGYTEYMHTANDEGFQRKVKLCMQKAAVDVLAEVPTTGGHSLRVTYANKILDGTASIYEMCVAVVTNPDIQTDINSQIDYDNDLQFVVNSMINPFAGHETGS